MPALGKNFIFCNCYFSFCLANPNSCHIFSSITNLTRVNAMAKLGLVNAQKCFMFNKHVECCRMTLAVRRLLLSSTTLDLYKLHALIKLANRKRIQNNWMALPSQCFFFFHNKIMEFLQLDISSWHVLSAAAIKSGQSSAITFCILNCQLKVVWLAIKCAKFALSLLLQSYDETGHLILNICAWKHKIAAVALCIYNFSA